MLQEEILKRTSTNPIHLSQVCEHITAPHALLKIASLIAQDVNGLDENIPRSLMSMVRTAIGSIEIIVVIAIATPLFVLAIMPLAFIYGAVLVHFFASISACPMSLIPFRL